MTSALGHLSVLAAGGVALWTIACCIAARSSGSGPWLRRARAGLVGVWVAFLAACLVLGAALVRGDFGLAYVAGHTEQSLAVLYRIAALWSGEQGSLLLWGFLASGVGAVLATQRRDHLVSGEWLTLAIPAAAGLMFAMILGLGADPFAASSGRVSHGIGLHPELRHWAMLAHPPILLLGYSLSLAPFAIVCGALAAGRSDARWVGPMRGWALSAWLCMSVGIALGAWWAYHELGWGGYWAWDPVENVSLLPWLTALSLLHVIAVHQKRGVLKGWTAGLSAATFILTLLGAAITRSGLVRSVHGFGGSSTGLILAAFAGLAIVGAAGLFIGRRGLLSPRAEIDGLLSRQGATLIGVVMLCVMGAAILAGTLTPVFMAGAKGRGISPVFYTRTVAPLGIAVIALMSISPLLGEGGLTAGRRSVATLAAGVTLMALLALVAGLHYPTVLLCTAILVGAVLSAGWDLARAARAFAANSGYGLVEAAARLIDARHRRYGGQVAHVGAALLVVGVAGSSLLKSSTMITANTGETVSVGRHRLRLDGLSETREPGVATVEAALTMMDGVVEGPVLRPRRRFYDNFGEAAPRMATASGWREDVLVSLVGWEAGGGTATVQVRLNPLTLWVWIGAGLMASGGVFCLLPRFLPRPAAALEGARDAASRAPAVALEVRS